MTTFAVIVPTLNPGPSWQAWLEAFAEQPVQPVQAVVIDSGSSGPEIEESQKYGFEIIRIAKSEFNHGGTRQKAVQHLQSSCEIAIFLTQDAILADPQSLANLLKAFDDPKVAAAYGRQLPHKDAGQLGAHARHFNYGATSSLRSLASVSELGFKTCFISNSFAAYRIKDLQAVGGFPSDVILGEDTCVAAKLVLSGKKIAYVADACVYHSHDYTILEEFRRYFDTGVLHAQEAWLLESFGGATGEGKRFVVSELKYLSQNAPYLIPSAMFRTCMKLFGYRLGRAYTRLPATWVRRCSMHKGFWQKRASS